MLPTVMERMSCSTLRMGNYRLIVWKALLWKILYEISRISHKLLLKNSSQRWVNKRLEKNARRRPHDLYAPPNTLGWLNQDELNGRGTKLVCEGRKGMCRVLLWKPEGKRQDGRPRRGWKDNEKTNLQEIGWKGAD